MRKNFSFVFLAVLMAAFGTLVYGQQQQDPMNDPVMKAMMEFATPGAAQKYMQTLVGTWDADVTSYWQDPSKPTVTRATATYTSLMDGRYVQEAVEGDFMGMPFRGLGTYGYDNLMKRYVSTWIDNMGTSIMMSCGTSTNDGKTINYVGRGSDPVAGKEQTYRSTFERISADKAHMEMYGPGLDGKDMKVMEITYTRRKP